MAYKVNYEKYSSFCFERHVVEVCVCVGGGGGGGIGETEKFKFWGVVNSYNSLNHSLKYKYR